MNPCVCGHTALVHHAHTGYCHDCLCSYFEEDLGRDETVSGPTYARWVAYEGFYNRHYTLDQETA
jgi:hypothetical protein